MLEWFIKFPEFTEYTEFQFHLGKTPLWVHKYTNPLNVTIRIS